MREKATCRHNAIDFTDYTFLKESEQRYPVKVTLWKKTQASRLALLPNLNYKDPAWQALFRDRAGAPCPVACHRPPRDQQGDCSSVSAPRVPIPLLPESPLFKPEYRKGVDRA